MTTKQECPGSKKHLRLSYVIWLTGFKGVIDWFTKVFVDWLGKAWFE